MSRIGTEYGVGWPLLAVDRDTVCRWCSTLGKPNSRFRVIVSFVFQMLKCVNCKWQIHNMSTGEPRDRHTPGHPLQADSGNKEASP
jgi:hypothetical protein